MNARFARDRETYKPDKLKEIERLYQVIGKGLNTPEAEKSLKELLEKYPKANRTGCAVQYLGQASTGEKREAYLKRAIEEFGDCYYGDGVQVGAYARFYLAAHYAKARKWDEASVLLDQIRKNYPDAVNHNGKRLVDLMPK